MGSGAIFLGGVVWKNLEQPERPAIVANPKAFWLDFGGRSPRIRRRASCAGTTSRGRRQQMGAMKKPPPYPPPAYRGRERARRLLPDFCETAEKNSPGGVGDCSPRRKPGVVEATCYSPGRGDRTPPGTAQQRVVLSPLPGLDVWAFAVPRLAPGARFHRPSGAAGLPDALE